MFMPGRNIQQELADKQAHYRRIEALAEELIPQPLRAACTISIQEVQCGDPQCAPIDTIITLLFDSGGQGMFGIPAEAKDVDKEELTHSFPTAEVLEKWFNGQEAEWPPSEPLSLRFDVGSQVICRVGPTNWLPGVVTQLWYREAQWPEGAMAPYKIHLVDGRDIFAPADVDQVIQPNTGEQRTEMPSAAVVVAPPSSDMGPEQQRQEARVEES